MRKGHAVRDSVGTTSPHQKWPASVTAQYSETIKACTLEVYTLLEWETACRLSRIDWRSRQKSILLITNFQLGNSTVKITQECCRKEENNPSCPKHKSNALHRHTQNQTTLFLLWSRLRLLGKCIAEGQRKKYSGIISASSYSFEACPMGNSVSSQNVPDNHFQSIIWKHKWWSYPIPMAIKAAIFHLC